jgi:hypothetical protein
MDERRPPPFPDSLCHGCAHRRYVETARSTFILCSASADDPRAKYPRQPVARCASFTARPVDGPPAQRR